MKLQSNYSFSIFKLAQGEYIAPEKIENVYARHPLIAQIFVYGESLQATLVAIVVPDPEVFPEWAKENGFVGDLKTLCVDAACTKAVLSEMTVFAKASDLKGFEHVKGILLHDDVFSVENQLLTPTFKLKRHEVQVSHLIHFLHYNNF